MKRKIRHQQNYAGPDKQVFNLPSLTVPDQSLSLRDLLSRYVRGQDIPVHEPVYLDEDSQVPVDLERMSPQDRVDLARAVRKEIKEKREAMAAKVAPSDNPLPVSPAPVEKSAAPVEEIEGI